MVSITETYIYYRIYFSHPNSHFIERELRNFIQSGDYCSIIMLWYDISISSFNIFPDIFYDCKFQWGILHVCNKRRRQLYIMTFDLDYEIRSVP